MTQPFTSDGATLEASYEHVCRVIEIAGLPFQGWSEMTGGGVQRSGQAYVYGAGDEPRALTDGKAEPQDLELKLEVATWRQVKAVLAAKAAAERNDISKTAYQKVPFQVIDQFRGATPTISSLTVTYTVKVSADKPETPADGAQFYQIITLKQTGIPSEEYST